MSAEHSHDTSQPKGNPGNFLPTPIKELLHCSTLQRSRLLCGVLLLTITLAIALPVLNITLIYPAFTDIIISSIEEDALRLAKHTLPASLKHTTLTNETLNNQFFAEIYKLETDFNVMKIKVFSAEGKVIYSTEATDIGHLNDKAYFKDVVVKGLPYTKLISKNTDTLEGQPVSIDVVETYAPFMDGKRFLGAFEMYYDITKRKRNMDQLIRYSTIGIILLSACLLTAVFILLRKEAARMAADENTERLKEEVERITRHDLKSPLTGVLSGLEYLEQFTELDEEQASIASDMRITANTGINMINRSLDLYKMETGSYEYAPASMDILTVARRVTSDLAVLSTLKGVTVLITKSGKALREDDTLPISSEETLCYSLIANLLKNAIEASTTGQGVTMTLTENGNVTLIIHNSGTVPEEIRETFFDKYTTADKSDGTGLGTYSAELMAQTLGGTIEMTTSEESGTRVCVTLPKNPPQKTT